MNLKKKILFKFSKINFLLRGEAQDVFFLMKNFFYFWSFFLSLAKINFSFFLFLFLFLAYFFQFFYKIKLLFYIRNLI